MPVFEIRTKKTVNSVLTTVGNLCNSYTPKSEFENHLETASVSEATGMQATI